MLKGIDPLLRGDILFALDRMGHGDVLAIVDANFPAWKIGGDRTIRLTGIDSGRVARAVLSVFPVDLSEPVHVMAPPNGQGLALHDLIEELSPEQAALVAPIDRWTFYEAAAQAVVLIQTGDKRPFGNMLLRKAGIN